MIKVSVIVPVYNGEKHLKECMDSICGQTLQDIEIICVDDSSTDSSMQILQNYQNNDDRIQIYQQDHKYAGMARNLGMTHATGEYLAFWDCDDFFDLQALEKLYDRAKSANADVCICGGNRYIESKGKSFPFNSYLNINKVPKEDVFNRFTNPDHYLDFTTAVAWNKLFKREYIEKQKLTFQPLRNANDVYFTMSALGLADCITCLNERLITYRVDRNNGLVSSASEAPLNPIQAWINVAKNLERYDGFGERSYANKALDSMIYLLSNIKTWEAFLQAVNALQDFGLEEMHIKPREAGYYYNAWNGECVQHLYEDTPEQLVIFLAYYRYTKQSDTSLDLRDVKGKLSKSNDQIKSLKEQVKDKEKKISELESQKSKSETENTKLKEEISRIRHSWTFKTGKVITWIPGKLRELIVGR